MSASRIVILGVVVSFLCGGCLGLLAPLEVVANLSGGWIPFLARVAPEITVHAGGVATALISLLTLVVGLHLFLGWLYAETHKPTEGAELQHASWRWRWSLSIVGVIVLMFVAGISAVGVSHQSYWLATSPEPLMEGGIRNAALRARVSKQLKQLVLAAHLYAENHAGELPPWAIQDAPGRPFLSWRVLLLPYIEEESLFREFRLDEPWDSPHNLKLLPRMPTSLQAGDSGLPYTTRYRVFVGPRTLYSREDGKSRYKISLIPDGASNTIFVAEAEVAVPWTKPDELIYAPQQPLPRLHLRLLAGMLDGAVHAIGANTSQETLRRAIEADDAQPLGDDW